MNELLFVLSSNINRMANSLMKLKHVCCGEVNVPETLTIQPSCFDWSSFGVALFACLVAIITCVFTILMYIYVKKQLNAAEEQLTNQITTNETNEEERKIVMNNTKNFVEQINLQILNNSLINLVEKKQRFLQDYDFLHVYLSENSILLKEGPVVQKAKELRLTIDNIVVNLKLINEILALFNKKNDILVKSYDSIVKSFEDLITKDTIATDMNMIDDWLDMFKKMETDYASEVEQAIEQIKNEIKQ